MESGDICSRQSYQTPISKDFFSHRKLFPAQKFKTSECRAKSVSVFSELEECAKIRKLPAHKNKKIVELTLPPESGLAEGANRSQQKALLLVGEEEL